MSASTMLALPLLCFSLRTFVVTCDFLILYILLPVYSTRVGDGSNKDDWVAEPVTGPLSTIITVTLMEQNIGEVTSFMKQLVLQLTCVPPFPFTLPDQKEVNCSDVSTQLCREVVSDIFCSIKRKHVLY